MSRRVWTDMADLHWSRRVKVGIRELGRVQEDLGGSRRFPGKFRRVWEGPGWSGRIREGSMGPEWSGHACQMCRGLGGSRRIWIGQVNVHLFRRVQECPASFRRLLEGLVRSGRL